MRHGIRLLTLFGFAAVVAVGPTVSAFSQGLETDAMLERVLDLYADAGRTAPTVSRPVSLAETLTLLDRLVRTSDTGDIRARAERLRNEVKQIDDGLEVRLGIRLQPEYYFNVERPSFLHQVRTEDPFALLTMGYGVPNGAYLLIEGMLQREWSYDDAPTNIPSPEDGNPVPFENNLVRQGYLFLPIGPADVTFGRQRVTLGPDPVNTLSVSAAIPFLDALKMTLTMGSLKMTSVTSTLENGRAQEDPSVIDEASDLYGYELTTILYNIHYFEYAWDAVRLGLGSQVVIARRANTFQLGDFFPVFSWHNARISPNNMSLLVDLTVTPYPGTEVFAQVGFDDINGAVVGIGDSAIPTIDAYIGGVRASLPWPDMSASAVAGYTHYLWGTFEDDEYLSRAIYRFEADGLERAMPLTSPHGPGALWFDLAVGGAFDRFSWETAYLAAGILPDASLYTTPYSASEELEESDRRWTHELTLTCRYDILDVGSLSVAPCVVFSPNGPRFGLEISGVLEYGLHRSLTR
ncbi:MAG: hypothetical protein ACOC0Y_00670 [Spirochaetota bacterium]